ncbi:MAG: hypothetical protein N2C12_00445 [Planctomycetales bacterium]
MSDPEQTSKPQGPGSSRYQFRLVTVMLVTALFCVLAAVFGGFFRHESDANYKTRFILLTMMVPTGIVTLLALFRWLFSRRGRPRKRRW